jgi:hypothetical protein
VSIFITYYNLTGFDWQTHNFAIHENRRN